MNLPKCLRQGCDQPVKRHDCKYCSLRCSGIVAQRRTKPHPCERCGKPLKGNQPKHCSLACRRGTPAPAKTCAECGKPRKGAKYCSRRCARIGARKDRISPIATRAALIARRALGQLGRRATPEEIDRITSAARQEANRATLVLPARRP